MLCGLHPTRRRISIILELDVELGTFPQPSAFRIAAFPALILVEFHASDHRNKSKYSGGDVGNGSLVHDLSDEDKGERKDLGGFCKQILEVWCEEKCGWAFAILMNKFMKYRAHMCYILLQNITHPNIKESNICM